MLYNFAADIFHTKKLCSRLPSSEVQFYTEIGRFAFSRLPLGDLWATYDDHLRLIGKRVVDFLLVLINFCARCHGWGATSEYLWKIVYFARTWVDWPKISCIRGSPATNHSSSQKTRLNDLSYDIKIWTDISFFHFVRNHAFDRRTDDGLTDRILIARPHSMQRCKKRMFYGLPHRDAAMYYASYLWVKTYM